MAGTLDETRDIHCENGDFLPHMPEVTGRLALAQRLGRRLTTPSNRFPFWKGGTDLRRYLLSKSTPDVIAGDAEDACMEDEQVQSIDVTVTDLNFETRQMDLSLAVTPADGDDFTFTMTITEAAATLIELQQEAA